MMNLKIFLGKNFLVFLYNTIKWQKIIDEKTQKLLENNEKIIISLWHEIILMAAPAFRNNKIGVMISMHRDGELISNICEQLGYIPIRGSSYKENVKALLKMKNFLLKNNIAAITIDGPRGPRRSVSDGIIYLAKKLSIPIVPLYIDVKKKKRINSWDKMVVPYPWTEGKIIISAPLYCKLLDIEKEKQILKQKMQELESQWAY